MSSEKAIKLAKRKKPVDLTRKEPLSMRIEPVTSKVCFDKHTQSSLMKRKEPMRLKRTSSSSTKCARDTQSKKKASVASGRKQGNINGICKKRSSIAKQSKSMQTVKMISQRKKEQRSFSSLPEDLTKKTVCQPKQRIEYYSLVFLRDDLITNVSRDLKKCTASPTKSVAVCGKPTERIVHQAGKHVESLYFSLKDENKLEKSSSTFVQGSSDSMSNCSKDRSAADVTSKIQSNERKAIKRTDSNCDIVVFHHELSSEEPTEKSEEDLLYEDRPGIKTRVYRQSRLANANQATSRKSTRKTWIIKKADNQKTHIDTDHAYHANLQGATNPKVNRKHDNSRNTRSVDAPMIRTKSTLQRDPAVKQQTWRPAGINRGSIAENTLSLTQSTSQKSRPTARYIASTRSKQTSSNEYVDSIDNETTKQMSANQPKMLMKENRDPCVDCISQICNHFAETKQRQKKLQIGAALPKRRQSTTKTVSKISSKNDIESMKSNSRSHYWQTRLITPRSLRNQSDANHCCAESTLTRNKRSRDTQSKKSKARSLEVIHALKKIINSVKEDDIVEENAMLINISNDVFYREGSDSERRMPNRDTSSEIMSNDELHFTQNNNMDRVVQSPDQKRSFQTLWNSITTQITEPNISSNLDPEKESDKNSKTIINSSKTVATQTSLCCNKNVEIGCNTVPCDTIYKDAEVSCDLINNFARVETNIDRTVIEDKLTSEDIEIIKDKSCKGNTNLPCNKDKDVRKGLNTNTSLKLRNYISMEVSEETINDFVRKTKTMVHKEDTNKQEKFKEYTDKGDANNLMDNEVFQKLRQPPFLIHDFDASCSSEEITEHVANDARYDDAATPRVQDVSSDVIAAFELAAERARNLYKAIMIYQESLTSTESERQTEETIENRDTLRSTIDENCMEKCVFSRNESEDKLKSEYETKCHFVMINNDFDGLSTCSDQTSCSSSDQMCQLGSCETCRADHCEIESSRADNVVLSQSENAITKPILDESSNIANVKSLMLVHRMQRKHALEMVKFIDDGDGGDFRTEESVNILAFPPIENSHEKISLISRKNLFLFICCILCTLVFWCLQFSFRCNPV